MLRASYLNIKTDCGAKLLAQKRLLLSPLFANTLHTYVTPKFNRLVAKTTILTNVSPEEAHSNHTHIFNYAPRNHGADAYKALVKEVMARLKVQG